MPTQQAFGKRLEQLLIEKDISQGAFADAVECSRQSINFYVLGKRNPDIILAGKMAKYLGVSCDYLIGNSDIREDKIAEKTANQLGLSDNTTKYFLGLQLLAQGKGKFMRDDCEKLGLDFEKDVLPYNMNNAKETLEIVNSLLSHERFGVLVQYIKRYKDIIAGKDFMAILQNFMVELESPITGKIYGSKQENETLMKEFCLHIVSKYFDKIVKDVVEK